MAKASKFTSTTLPAGEYFIGAEGANSTPLTTAESELLWKEFSTASNADAYDKMETKRYVRPKLKNGKTTLSTGQTLVILNGKRPDVKLTNVDGTYAFRAWTTGAVICMAVAESNQPREKMTNGFFVTFPEEFTVSYEADSKGKNTSMRFGHVVLSQ